MLGLLLAMEREGVLPPGGARRAVRWVAIFTLALLALPFVLLVACSPAHAQSIPAAAKGHQRELTRVVQQEWGLGGSVAIHAAQIHQESAWRSGAKSHVGAQGLSQFMPATAGWIAEIYPDLGAPAPFSPTWSMRAQARYNHWHWNRITALDDCQRWAMTLSAYNGGLGWVQRDQRLARAAGDDARIWFDHVENHTARAGWARKENRDYVRRILLQLEPLYRLGGWQGEAPC